jgi:hypothetical protein
VNAEYYYLVFGARFSSSWRYGGGYTVVKDYVRGARLPHKKSLCPGASARCQADFGEGLVVIGGVEQKGHFFAWICRTPTTFS